MSIANRIPAGPLWGLMALVLVSCGGEDDPDETAYYCPEGTTHEARELVSASGAAVDVLVVMDNSRSMSEGQASMARDFPALIEALLDPPVDPGTGVPLHTPVTDLHIGVISTDMGTGGYMVETCSDPIDGDDGVLQHTPHPAMSGCAAAYPTYLSYSSPSPDPMAISQMGTDFGCVATLGTDGCGFEQHLEAILRAIEHTHAFGPNAGFVREDSTLAILVVSDEEDCSVKSDPESQAIFDTTRTDLGHLNLRCYHHPYMVEPVETYVTALRGLRPDPGKLLVGFIVGVPDDPTCEGSGSDIPACLDHPNMIEQIDPTDPTRLSPSCTTSTSLAFPPRRMVQVAQQLGRQGMVHSICTDDFGPAITSFTGRLQEIVETTTSSPELPAGQDISFPCRCVADCTMREVLPDLRDCASVGKPCWIPEGDQCYVATDDLGFLHSVCVIPQAWTNMSPCDPANPPACGGSAVTHAVEGEGWYYLGPYWRLGTGEVQASPQVQFTPGWEPEEGSVVYLDCCI